MLYIIDSKLTSKYMAVLCYGQYDHPSPPLTRIPLKVKNELIRIIVAFGAAECTARRLVASPILPIMLNGQTELTAEHIALANHDSLNHLIRKLREVEFPWGTSFQGVQYLIYR